jgi:hypothetical protein
MSDADRAVLADIDAIAAAHARASGESGEFWQNLGAKHRMLIEQFGFAEFKRTVNFEYGQWCVTSVRHPLVKRLIWELLRRGRIPIGGLLANYDPRDTANIRWPDRINSSTGMALDQGSGSLRAYAVYCGLLWQFAAAIDRLGCLAKVNEPAAGHPLPIHLRGHLISQDLAIASLELNRIAEYAPSPRRILEIGAGYGRMAHLICAVFPEVQYFIVDISPALAISQNYLSAVFGTDAVARYSDDANPLSSRCRINCLLPHQLESISEPFFDLCINVSSFDEMPPAIVSGYLNAIGRTGSNGLLYLNGFARATDRRNRLGLDELPYPQSWTQLYYGEHPTTIGFVECVFHIS